MKIHALIEAPNAELGAALASFEERFSYPLGTDSRFSVSHGDDYARFFRAIGESSVFVAEHRGEVLGTIGGAVRRVECSDGRALTTLYVGDLKVLPGLDAGLTLLRLAAAMKDWAEPRVVAAFGIAMDGTRKTPERYTGRFGIPRFVATGKIMVLRVPCEAIRNRTSDIECTASEGSAIFRALTGGGNAAGVGRPDERSSFAPRWLRLEDGAACGMLEDTRRAKRLFEVGGTELVSAHLSAFAFKDARSGAELLRFAASLAAALEFPALFCSVSATLADALVQGLGSLAPTLAPATVYGAGLPMPSHWYVNTSEI